MPKKPLSKALIKRIADRAEARRGAPPPAERSGNRAGRPRTNPIRTVVWLLPAHVERLDRFRHSYGEMSRQAMIRFLIERLP